MTDTELDWLYARQALGIRLGLEKVHRLLAAIGDPHRRFKSIHIAGTNGKGSVARMLAATLINSGHRTGLTTSPHLIRFTERFEIDGKPVSLDEVEEGLALLRPHVEASEEPPTFFEIVTALAFWLFARHDVEWAVVETGMGGRLDATNVLDPAVCIITNVDLDHAGFLGQTRAEIAYEKAGIMKPGVPCVTAATGDALVILKSVSHERRVPMGIIGEDYQYEPAVGGMSIVLPGKDARYDVGLAGEHQLQNAALVVATVDCLRHQGLTVPERAVQQALAHTRHPGRLERMHVEADRFGGEGLVEILIDGAHNEAAAHAVRRHLLRLDWSGHHLIVGFNKDKAWQKVLEQWVPVAARVWGVPLRNPRSLDPGQMEGLVREVGMPFATAPDVEQALRRAVAEGARRILIAGSIYLAGEALAVLGEEGLEEIRGSQ